MTTVRLAFKNLLAKPWRSLAIVVAVALAVAMFFCMFSFKDAVYDYVYAVETSDSGNSDIIIKSKSNGDRVALTAPLRDVDGIEEVSPSLSLYALLDGEYVRLRGFESGKIETLNRLKPLKGDVSALALSDNVAVSEAAAEHFGLDVGDMFTVSSGHNNASFVVAVIAENDGYFLDDSPYCVIGTAGDGVARLLHPSGFAVFNEVYVKASPGIDTKNLIAAIAAMPEYSEVLVSTTSDRDYIAAQADSIAAPVTIAGLAVVLLAAAGIVVLFLMSAAEKRTYASKLSVIGAARGQILSVFLAESLILAFIGAVAGSLIASGVFMLLLKVTLSSVVVFSVGFGKLFGAAALGAVLTVAASLYPLIRAFGDSARESELGTGKKSLASRIAPPALLAAAAAALIVEGTVKGARGALSIVNVILVLAAAAACAPYVLKAAAAAAGRLGAPALKIASLSVRRDRRAARSGQLLTVGMTVGMLLFMAWSLTTSIFRDYTSDFEDMVLVTNVKADVDPSEFTALEGVEKAVVTVWKQGGLSLGESGSKTVNVLGSEEVLNLIDFGYVTPREIVEERLSSGSFIILDRAMSELYGIRPGDEIDLALDGASETLTVGGIISHRLFSGNYAIVSKQVLETLYGAAPDTVLAVAARDADDAAGEIRAAFSDRNYYAVTALEAFAWESRSLESVFDLIGTLAFVLTALVFVVLTAGVIVGRAASAASRRTMLAAGVSKNTLLSSELSEHALTALCSFVISFGASAAATFSLIGALRLFGLYFEFIYSAGIVAAVGAVVGAAYALLPLALCFRKKYTMRRD